MTTLGTQRYTACSARDSSLSRLAPTPPPRPLGIPPGPGLHEGSGDCALPSPRARSTNARSCRASSIPRWHPVPPGLSSLARGARGATYAGERRFDNCPHEDNLFFQRIAEVATPPRPRTPRPGIAAKSAFLPPIKRTAPPDSESGRSSDPPSPRPSPPLRPSPSMCMTPRPDSASRPPGSDGGSSWPCLRQTPFVCDIVEKVLRDPRFLHDDEPTVPFPVIIQQAHNAAERRRLDPIQHHDLRWHLCSLPHTQSAAL
ncbi:hypothetical protein Q5P01_001020 [Channa striata]|uniref:Uncharacterized protein n=1 Tax=Channa striata TaxID=64152 RepID=A0AA88LJ95_CHASR|nr:hypothetical protein Q5P01_001020 [Channa striata]